MWVGGCACEIIRLTGKSPMVFRFYMAGLADGGGQTDHHASSIARWKYQKQTALPQLSSIWLVLARLEFRYVDP